MYLIDYHTHTSFSSDSQAPMEDMILSAIDKGLDEMAITDHVDFDDRYDYTDYNRYIPYFNELKEKYADKIKLCLGVEVGVDNYFKDKVNAFTKSFDFDFIIGSSHAVTGKDLYFDREDFFAGKTKQTAYNQYFSELLKNIELCEDFCVYGHLDFVSRYGIYEDNSLKYADYKDIIDEVLRTLINKGKGIEINTSGFRYGIADAYPQLDIVKRYKQLGGEIITVGSDSHFTRDVADHIGFAYDMLAEAGFKYITTFEKRKPVFVKL